ncbi:hypothetical protein ACJMK2_015809 [Sinanodonta woodiana]|uniref:PDZ domain-containing protein n=1 Tax=Sinanodonta woodiana TaxID=1069815 RepID=A0ABD3URK4_SINWO
MASEYLQVVYVPHKTWTWKPLRRSNKREHSKKLWKMAEVKRSEAIFRNLAHELLTEEECCKFKEALHHFRVSNSVASLVHQLKPVINSTEKIFLLIELSSRIPKNLQADYHRLCCLQYSDYDSYLKILTNGKSMNEIPKIIAQDSSGTFRIVSRGSQKKIMVKYDALKNSYELQSVPGTSVTSGIYSENDDGDDVSDVFDGNNRPATPTYLKDRDNVRPVFLQRKLDGTLGLGITGGKEYGVDIIINVVEETGPAANVGLKPGDRILEVNGNSFINITHAEAVIIMQNAWNLIMMVQSMPQDNTADELDGDVIQEVDLELIIYPNRKGKLGCLTNRLHNGGLVVKSVQSNSPAQKAGLLTNDIIFKIDGISVRELSEKQIVMLTDAKRMVVTIHRKAINKREHFTYSEDQAQHGRQGKFETTDTFSSQMAIDPISGFGVFHPEKQSRIQKFKPELDRNHASRRGSHSSFPFSSRSQESSHDREYASQHRAQMRHQNDKPEHFVFDGRKSLRDGNWALSTSKPKEHRYTQHRGNNIVNQNYYPWIYGRSHSEENLDERYPKKEIPGRVTRYVRSRSQSPHRNSSQVQQIYHKDVVMQAIQRGLEKRQRAIRLALYQMPDPADYEWEI